MIQNLNRLLHDYSLITYEDNVIWAERAFMAHSAARWCVEKIETKDLTPLQIESFGDVLLQYLKGDVDLFWSNGVLRVQDREEKNERLA